MGVWGLLGAVELVAATPDPAEQLGQAPLTPRAQSMAFVVLNFSVW